MGMKKSKKIPKERSLVVRDGMDLYFREIHSAPLLSPEEEQKLALAWYEDRDREAARQLAVSNLRFVVKVAREYTRYGFRLGDLVQEGNLGLLHAIGKFDPRRGYRLITYAVWWIRAYIQSFILKSWSIVRTGTTRVQRRIFGGLQKARRKIAAMNPSEPTQEKLVAKQLNVSQEELKEEVARMQRRDLSLDQPTRTDSDLSLHDAMANEEPSAETQLIDADLREKVREILDGVYDELTPRERYLLDHRLLSDHPATLEAVGHEFGVTRERVRQLETRLKNKLRKELSAAMSIPPAHTLPKNSAERPVAY